MISYGVNTVVLDGDKVLLTLRSDFPVWCLPGGAIEPSETLANAAIRETYEETGAEIQLERLVGVYSRPNWRDSGNHEIVFAGTQIAGTLQPLDGEAVEVGYFPISELPDTLLWWHRERIFDALDGQTGTVRMQNVTLPESINGLSHQESIQALQDGQVPLQDVVIHLTQKPIDAESKIEI